MAAYWTNGNYHDGSVKYEMVDAGVQYVGKGVWKLPVTWQVSRVGSLVGDSWLVTSPGGVEYHVWTEEVNSAAVKLGRSGGRSTSDVKTAASRLNGRKGGRPRKDIPS